MADASQEARIGGSALALAPGVERVRLGGGDLGLVSDQVSLRLEGASADAFDSRLLARLDGTRSVDDLLAGWAPKARGQALALLEQFLDAGVVVEVEAAAPSGPVASMLTALGVRDDGLDRLGQATVGVVGLEGPGAHVATHLATMGVGTLVLVDPFPLVEGDRELWPPVVDPGPGTTRQDVVADLLDRVPRTRGPDGPGPARTVRRPLVDAKVERPALDDALVGCDALVHCWDRGFAASAAWVNDHALATDTIALFGRLEGHVGWAGPMVFPGEGPCWLCSRMRTIANAEDFDLAMGLEEAFDRQHRPNLAGRPGFPNVSAQLGAMLAMELVKVLLAIGSPRLVGGVVAVDGLQLTTDRHAVLQRPDCPACRKKGRPPRRRGETRRPVVTDDASVESPGLADAQDSLVSRVTGIVRSLGPVPRDPVEPLVPVVYRAELANHRFVATDDDPFEVCSGKGMTAAAARVSALGEACERYSGARCDPGRLVVGRRDQVPGRTLDPTDLVLFAPHQYASLPYRPWHDDTTLDWVDGRDVATGEAVFVPALAALMHHEVHHQDGWLFPITSNGLAAGPTLDGAILAATLEVVERDAFVIGWLQRLPAGRIDPTTVPDDTVRDLAERYARRGVALELYLLATDVDVPVALAMGIDHTGTGPSAVLGLGCDLDPVTACRGAALEVGQVRPALKSRLRDPETRARQAELVADPSRVSALEDHDALFAHADMLPHLDFWRDAGPQAFDHPSVESRDVADRLGDLVDRLRRVNTTVVAVDLTAEEFAPLGVHAARAIVPGFQPIHFGAAEARLGGSRLYDLPGRLGLPAAAADPTEVDGLPHPLS